MEAAHKSVVRKIRKALKDKKITPFEVYGIVRTAMESVEGIKPPLSGHDKKGAVLAIVLRVIKNEKSELASILRQSIDSGLFEATIDLIVDATQGKVAVNTNGKDSTSCPCVLF